jgi:hypothetical protein
MSGIDGISAQLDSMLAQASQFSTIAEQVAGVVQSLVSDPNVQNPGFGADSAGQAAAQRLLTPLQSGVQAAADLSGVLTQFADNIANWVQGIIQLDASS